MMGGIFAIVGPSGVGKDTLMQAALAEVPDLCLVRRVITRPEAAGGEAFTGVSPAEFALCDAAGGFALSWQAHGLFYGIPVQVHDDLAAGRSVLFNGSRAMLVEAARVFPELKVLHVTASRAVLEARLLARGRESTEEIARRLDRACMKLPKGLEVITIDNSGSLSAATRAFVDALRLEQEKPKFT
ncbi:phosphonate metabolism protein/1,5-bisphosphokinase (PRPP-forming) PhnN [Rhodobacteraceae bacterium M382]|nr:phosphonate metabolism protein/1,5-bisphosphokinase (PRPP-forming) PhnN [Rhodobacteraceae bacterium M382]